MSSIVSRRPSFRNQSNDAFWISMRCGSSRTCFTREKDLRARGAATLAVKRYSLPYNGEESEISDKRKRRNVSATCKGTENRGRSASGALPGPRCCLDGSAKRLQWEARATFVTNCHKRGKAARRRPSPQFVHAAT